MAQKRHETMGPSGSLRVRRGQRVRIGKPTLTCDDAAFCLLLLGASDRTRTGDPHLGKVNQRDSATCGFSGFPRSETPFGCPLQTGGDPSFPLQCGPNVDQTYRHDYSKLASDRLTPQPRARRRAG